MYVQTNKKPWPWYIPSLACYFSNVKKNYKKKIFRHKKRSVENMCHLQQIFCLSIFCKIKTIKIKWKDAIFIKLNLNCLGLTMLIYLQTKLHVKYFCFQTNHMLCFAQPVVSSPPSHQQVGREKENSFLLLHNLFIYCMFFRYL